MATDEEKKRGSQESKYTVPALIKRIVGWLTPPTFDEDPEKTRVAQVLNTFLLAFSCVIIITAGASFAIQGLPETMQEAYIPLASPILLLVIGILLVMEHKGFVATASFIILSLLWSVMTFWIYGFGSEASETDSMVYILIIVLSGLLMSGRAVLGFTIASALAVAGSFYPWSTMVGDDMFNLVLSVGVIALVGPLLNYAVSKMHQALDLARRNESALAERTRELEASQRVTFAASEHTDPDSLLRMVVNLIRDQFDLYHAQVYIIDPERDAAVLRESTGYAGRQLLRQNHEIPLDHPALVTRAIYNLEPVLVNNVEKAPDFLPNPLLPETKSELVVPLKVGDEIIGVLDVQDRVVDRFNQQTVALFQTMAEQIAFLFENSELLQRVSEQTKALTAFTNQLRTAADIARQLGSMLDPELLLNRVVELLQSRFGLYHVHVYLLEEKDDDLVVKAGSGEVGRILESRGHTIPLEAEKSLVARSAREQQTVLVNDTSLESDFLPNPLLPETRSEVSVPFIVGEKTVGVLDVQDTRPNRFSDTDVDTFNTLAGQISIALQNAGLFEQVEQNLRQTRARYRVSQALAGRQTEPDVLDAMIDVARSYPQAGIAIFLHDEEQGDHVFTQAHASHGEHSILFPRWLQQKRLSPKQLPLIDAIDPDTPLALARLPSDGAEGGPIQVEDELSAANMALFPIATGQEWLGLLIALAPRDGYFDQEKIVLYQSLADQSATALRMAHLYEQVQRTAERLREVDQLKSEFLANMSHELRTPLNSIIGYTEIMLMGLDADLDPETLEDVQAIYDNGKHLLRIINDVLDLAKIEAGRLSLNVENVEPQSLIEEAKSSATGLLHNKPVELVVDVEENLPRLRGDRGRLNQVLNNLVSNAVKFTDEGSITMRSFRQDGWVCFEVEDTGIGISDADLEKIFERFSQGDSSSARRAQGTGLGLALTRHLIQMHGGTINVKSQLGEGSTFAVRLPVDPPADLFKDAPSVSD